VPAKNLQKKGDKNNRQPKEVDLDGGKRNGGKKERVERRRGWDEKGRGEKKVGQKREKAGAKYTNSQKRSEVKEKGGGGGHELPRNFREKNFFLIKTIQLKKRKEDGREEEKGNGMGYYNVGGAQENFDVYYQ